MLIKNDKNEDIEVFTAAEVDVKTKEIAEKAVEDFKSSNPDKSQELAQQLEDLKDRLADKEIELQTALNDDGDGKNKAQIDRLRKERDEAKKLAQDAMKGIDSKIEEFRKEIVGDTKSQYLEKLAGGDVELRKKIEFHFDNYRPSAVSKKDIEERMAVAMQLVTGEKPKPNFLDGRISAGDRGDGGGYNPPQQKELNQNQKAIGVVLGINDKDREIYKKFEEEMSRKNINS